MKLWREAATLILAARKPRSFGAASADSPLAQNNKPVEHNESTSNNNIEHQDSIPNWGSIFDYQVLMLKRSSKSKFMPNAYVFPGGVSSSADFSSGWLDYFQSHGFHKTDLEQIVLKEGTDRPFLLQGKEEIVARDIAFRLTAIRETFEESGILLHHCKNSKEGTLAHNFQSQDEIEVMRKRVHKDPEQMLNLYKELELVPDIWNLLEWSDWLTPVNLHEQGARRFDTLFYLACLPELPHTILENREITAVSWTEPASILDQFYKKELWLAPPQVYELSRLLNFCDMKELQEFSVRRQKEGCENWLPVRLQCEDGLLSLLPGDDLYPAQPDYYGNPDNKKLQAYEGTIQDSMTQCKHLNRLTFKDKYQCIPKVNITPSHKHVVPLEYQHFNKLKF